MPDATCVFCRSPLSGCRSREHVFPVWLLDELGIADSPVAPTHFRPDGQVASSRLHLVKNLREGRVCVSCNSGWMSALETACKPLLLRLFSSNKSITALNSDERLLLARWATKTAFVLNSSSNFNCQVPAGHLFSLRRRARSLPGGTAVLAQQHSSTEPFSWVQSSSWILVGPQNRDEEKVKRLVDGAYKICLQFADLLLLVARWPRRSWRLCLWSGVHIPIWPIGEPWGYRVFDDEFPRDDSLKATVWFLGTLGAIHTSAITHKPFGA